MARRRKEGLEQGMGSQALFQGRTAQDSMQACEDKIKDLGTKLGGGVRSPLTGIYHPDFDLSIK